MNYRLVLSWQHTDSIDGIRYECGYCGTNTSPSRGWTTDVGPNNHKCFVAICTFCNRPSFIETVYGRVISAIPSPVIGNDIEGLPDDIRDLYEEARRCTGVGAYTSAVLTCRKILMHIAVEKGASPDQSFSDYVQYLADIGYVPPNGKDWVDYIRRKGNEANHEIVIMSSNDAQDLISFIEMLLRLVYEFKHRLSKDAAS